MKVDWASLELLREAAEAQVRPGRATPRGWVFVSVGLGFLCLHTTHATVLYVDANATNPTPPYSSSATAATVIQDAIDAAAAGDQVLVTNGVYSAGGRAVVGTTTNRAAVDKPLTLLSVNGAQFTVIQGYQVPGTTNGDGAIRCVYLTNGASLTGFTVTGGATGNGVANLVDGFGGGILGESNIAAVSNCVLVGNAAGLAGGGAYGCALEECLVRSNMARFDGGGALGCDLYRCTVDDNTASEHGGGVSSCTLYNCTLTGNVATYGGGASASTLNNCTLNGNWVEAFTPDDYPDGGTASDSSLNNCIVAFDSFAMSPSAASYCKLNYCCTVGFLPEGVGNITNAPLFVDVASGNLRLQSNSPCINAGNNRYVTTSSDLDGNPRIVSGTVDIGAYEYQGPGSIISYAWLQQYGLPTDGSADYADPDGDGMNNWQEWRCGTNPTNALSALRMVTALPNGTNVIASWRSVAGVSYQLERSTNLLSVPAFMLISTGLLGQPETTSYTDTNAPSVGSVFYRVGAGY